MDDEERAVPQSFVPVGAELRVVWKKDTTGTFTFAGRQASFGRGYTSMPRPRATGEFRVRCGDHVSVSQISDLQPSTVHLHQGVDVEVDGQHVTISRNGMRPLRSQRVIYIRGGSLSWELRYADGASFVVDSMKRMVWHSRGGGSVEATASCTELALLLAILAAQLPSTTSALRGLLSHL